MTRKPILILAIFMIGSVGAMAQMDDMYDIATSNLVKDLITDDILDWINDPIVVSAVRQANRDNRGRTLDEIEAADQRWRAVRGVNDFIRIYLENDTSDFLRVVQDDSNGLYAEIFVMDNQGVNVAQTDKTSDLWQGDEAKFTESFSDGDGAVHVGEVEFDESAQSYLVQVSLPIYDDDANEVIGAVTVGIDMSRL